MSITMRRPDALMSFAASLTRAWAAAYTFGLAAHVRDARRREIDSDVWEHQHDAEGASSSPGIALQLIGRMLRGVPADLLWRINVEGPQMDIRIPVERIMGGALVVMVALVVITGSISGIDTSREDFSSVLLQFADKSAIENRFDATFRIGTGLSWILVAAVIFRALRERAPMLGTLAAFGMLVGAGLELMATAFQIVLVDLSGDYVAAAAADRPGILSSAHTVALVVEMTTILAVGALLASVYVVAIATLRENLVPRWLFGIPVLSVGALASGMTISAAGGGDTWVWIVIMSGLMLGVIWLLIAGLWMVFNPVAAERDSAHLPATA